MLLPDKPPINVQNVTTLGAILDHLDLLDRKNIHTGKKNMSFLVGLDV